MQLLRKGGMVTAPRSLPDWEEGLIHWGAILAELTGTMAFRNGLCYILKWGLFQIPSDMCTSEVV